MNHDNDDVFISWAGDRAAKVALLIKRAVENLLTLRCFLSTSDSGQNDMAGHAFHDKIVNKLKQVTIGIVIIDLESKDSQWLNYECGVLTSRSTPIIPVVLGEARMLPAPLSRLSGSISSSLLQICEMVRARALEAGRPCNGSGLNEQYSNTDYEREWLSVTKSIASIRPCGSDYCVAALSEHVKGSWIAQVDWDKDYSRELGGASQVTSRGTLHFFETTNRIAGVSLWTTFADTVPIARLAVPAKSVLIGKHGKLEAVELGRAIRQPLTPHKYGPWHEYYVKIVDEGNSRMVGAIYEDKFTKKEVGLVSFQRSSIAPEWCGSKDVRLEIDDETADSIGLERKYSISGLLSAFRSSQGDRLSCFLYGLDRKISIAFEAELIAGDWTSLDDVEAEAPIARSTIEPSDMYRRLGGDAGLRVIRLKKGQGLAGPGLWLGLANPGESLFLGTLRQV